MLAFHHVTRLFMFYQVILFAEYDSILSTFMGCTLKCMNIKVQFMCKGLETYIAIKRMLTFNMFFERHFIFKVFRAGNTGDLVIVVEVGLLLKFCYETLVTFLAWENVLFFSMFTCDMIFFFFN